MAFSQARSPGVESFERQLSIQMPVVEGVAEGLQAVDARGLTGRGAILNDLACDLDNFLEAGANLIEKTRPARHRIPEDCVDLLTAHVPDHKYLEIASVHIQHACGCHADRFEEAVGDHAILAGRKRESVSYHIGVEAHRIDFAATALLVRRGEVLSLPVGRQGGNALAADRAHRIAVSRETLDCGGCTDVHETEPHALAQVDRLLPPAPCGSSGVLISFEAVDGDPHLEAKFLLIRDVRLVGEVDVTHRDGG